jgi:periplasmic copper chaperone A
MRFPTAPYPPCAWERVRAVVTQSNLSAANSAALPAPFCCRSRLQLTAAKFQVVSWSRPQGGHRFTPRSIFRPGLRQPAPLPDPVTPRTNDRLPAAMVRPVVQSRQENPMKKLFLVTAIGFSLMSTTAFSHEYKLGNLEIIHPYTRPTPPKAPVSGGYMTIRNTGTEDDRLVGASAPFAGKVEVHEMKMDGDVMKMREINGALTIPAGGEVTLEPGGLHIMFTQLKEQIREGKKYTATLQFEKSGSVEIEFSADKPKGENSGNHSGHSMGE